MRSGRLPTSPEVGTIASMKPWLEATADDVDRLSDPTRFSGFVDALIRASAVANHVAQLHIKTNLRQFIKDGGVDAQVDVGFEDGTGRFAARSAWQYKAGADADIKKLTNELKAKAKRPSKTTAKPKGKAKPAGSAPPPYQRVRELIEQGYAYRVAVRRSLTPRDKSNWEDALTAAVKKINVNAPAVVVVAADDLAAWATSWPAVVWTHFRPHTSGVFALDDELPNARERTPTYEPIPLWDPIADAIEKHVDFGITPDDATIAIRGPAGVGKTRFVLETLARLPGSRLLALYTAGDREALEVASNVASTDRQVILVADEAGLEAQAKLANLLVGADRRGRIRVVAIHNTGESREALVLRPMPEADLTALLEHQQRFESVPPDRRRQYVELAKGYVRLATALCEDDPLATQGALVANRIADYLARRAGSARLPMAALALFTSVGWRDEVESELGAMCEVCELGKLQDVRRALRGLKDHPGFVAEGGRYLYVTPEIVAMWAFDEGWKTFVEPNVDGFVSKLSGPLLEAFQRRIRETPDEEVRRRVGESFRASFVSLGAEALIDPRTARRVSLLVEIDPAQYLPALARILSEASRADILRVKGRPRRDIVFLLGRLAQLPEHFADVEVGLRALALGEAEPGLGNNARECWCQLFRVYLSGTPLPIEMRLPILEQLSRSEDVEEAELAVQALEGAIPASGVTRIGLAKRVAGRTPPAEWEPDHEQYRHANRRILDSLASLAKSRNDAAGRAARDALASRARVLLYRGELDLLASTFEAGHVPDEVLPTLLRNIGWFLQYEAARLEKESEEQRHYVARVRDWYERVPAANLHGRLNRLVGRSTMEIDAETRTLVNTQQDALDRLAAEIVADTDALKAEMAWLCSDYARGAYAFGERIGRHDRELTAAAPIFLGAYTYGQAVLARGYAEVIVSEVSGGLDWVTRALDILEEVAPALSFEIASASSQRLRLVRRALRMTRSGALPRRYLWAPVFFYVGAHGPAAEAIELLRECAHSADREGAEGALGLAWHWLFMEESRNALLGAPELVDTLWDIVERTIDSGRMLQEWEAVLAHLATVDPARAIEIAARALAGGAIERGDEAEQVLQGLAKERPAAVMEALGRQMLDPERGWVFSAGKFGIFSVLPQHVVESWLEKHGELGARRIARHLPAPHLEGGRPVVPPLTAYVLERFASDDETFGEFVAGTHSGVRFARDLAEQAEHQAELARLFLTHPMRRIRQWAQQEVRQAEADARRWRQENEERDLRGF